MPGASRSLPDRPNLRYLRLEAKRRLAAGEFPTLHDAQLAIAREYGEPSWAALKQAIGETETDTETDTETEATEPGSPALDQMRPLLDHASGPPAELAALGEAFGAAGPAAGTPG